MARRAVAIIEPRKHATPTEFSIFGLRLGYKHLTPTESDRNSKFAQKSFMEFRYKLHQ